MSVPQRYLLNFCWIFFIKHFGVTSTQFISSYVRSVPSRHNLSVFMYVMYFCDTIYQLLCTLCTFATQFMSFYVRSVLSLHNLSVFKYVLYLRDTVYQCPSTSRCHRFKPLIRHISFINHMLRVYSFFSLSNSYKAQSASPDWLQM